MARVEVDRVESSVKSGRPASRAFNRVDIKKLLEAGAHFGHQTSRWHPKMAPYIHSKRGGSHIIDLTKTVENLEAALDFLAATAGRGRQILLVSTKRQAKDVVKGVAIATSMPYVTQRWLGGMLTNQATIGARIRRLKDLESRMLSGELAAKYSKLEVQRFAEEIEAMNSLYGGIKDMNGNPAAIFIVDTLADGTAVREARKLAIPVVALVDTNTDPTLIDYPIPANDDATKAIKLIMEYVMNSIEAGKKSIKAPAVDKTEKQPGASSPKPRDEEATAADKPKAKASKSSRLKASGSRLTKKIEAKKQVKVESGEGKQRND